MVRVLDEKGEKQKQRRNKPRNKSRNPALNYEEIQRIRLILKAEEDQGNKKNSYNEIQIEAEKQVPRSPGSVDSGHKEPTRNRESIPTPSRNRESIPIPTRNRNIGSTPTTAGRAGNRGSTQTTGHGGLNSPPSMNRNIQNLHRVSE